MAARAALTREQVNTSARRALYAASRKSDEELQPARDELSVVQQRAVMQMLQEAIRVRDVSAFTVAIEAAETVNR